MKKIILIILLVMLAPMIVLADAAGPKGLGYDAVVINKNGAKYVEYTDYGEEKEHIIPYNTKIRIIEEDEYGGETVNACNYSDINNCYEKQVRILKKDIAPLKDEVIPNDMSNNLASRSSLIKYDSKLIILKDGGVKLKKGPADAFKDYNIVIPKNTTVNTTHCVDRGKDSIGYCYVDSNDYKGWIDASYDSGVYIKKLSKAMFFADTDFYSDENLTKKIFTIPAFTVIDDVYECNRVFVKYNGQEGFAEWGNFAYESKLGYVLTLKKAELKKNGKVLTIIPAGEKVKIKYGSDDTISDFPYHKTYSSYCDKNNNCYHYVVYKDQEGFVKAKDVESLYYESKVIDKTFKYALKVYDFSNYDRKDNESDEEYYKRHETGKVIPANTKVTSYNQVEEEELVKFNDIIGWVVLDEVGRATEVSKTDDETKDKPTETEVKENNNDLEENKNNNTENVSPVNDPNKNEEKNNAKKPINKSSDTLTFALIGAVLVCMTAVVTTLIVNSINKKNNVVEKKEEIKVETPKKKDDTKEVENKETTNSTEGEKKE